MDTSIALSKLYSKFDPSRTKYVFDIQGNDVNVTCKLHQFITPRKLKSQLSPDISHCCPFCNTTLTRASFGHFIDKDGFLNCMRLKYPELCSYINKLSLPDESFKNFQYNKPVKFICSEHGAFKTTPKEMYMFGRLCPVCAHQRNWDKRVRKTDASVIEDARKIHRDKYDYSELHYTGPKDKMKIICHKKTRLGQEHGAFFQTYNKHISQKEGCPICAKNASYLEDEMCWRLDDAGITYIRSHRFPFKKCWPIDIWIPDLNVVIECQGRQHFTMENNLYHKSLEAHQKLLSRDEEKYKLLTDNGITVLYFATCEIPEDFKEKHTYYSSSQDIIDVLNKLKEST